MAICLITTKDILKKLSARMKEALDLIEALDGIEANQVVERERRERDEYLSGLRELSPDIIEEHFKRSVEDFYKTHSKDLSHAPKPLLRVYAHPNLKNTIVLVTKCSECSFCLERSVHSQYIPRER